MNFLNKPVKIQLRDRWKCQGILKEQDENGVFVDSNGDVEFIPYSAMLFMALVEEPNE